MSWLNRIPFLSQIKSAVQAISGDTEGARQTQEEFSKQAPVVSQIRSGIEAISGNADAAKRTQEEFLHKTLYETPLVSQGISAGYALAGDPAEAKRVQQQFLDENVRTVQALLSSSWLKQCYKLATSDSLSDRSEWMKALHGKRLYEMLLPGTHDTATYRFADAAFVTNWAQAQQFSVYDQLKGGIRYLDIRVNKDKHDGKIYCSHTFFTIPFEDVVNDIHKFIVEHPSEVIVFAVQGDGGNDQLKGAGTIASKTLGGFMTDSIEGDETLGQLVAKKNNILYTPDHRCGNLSVANSWYETQDSNPVAAVDKCLSYAKSRTRSPKNLVLMALEATLFAGGTTGAIESIMGEINSLGQGLELLAQYSNYATLHTFLADQKAVAGANVINIDFANDEIIGKVVSMN